MGYYDAAAVVASNAINAIAQTNLNDENWEQNWKMWHATNEYNSPVNQMARFQAAGLNPNLIYGQSNTTSPMNMAIGKAPYFEAPKMNDTAYFDYQQKKEIVKGAKLDNRIKEIQSNILDSQDIIWQNRAFYSMENEALKASNQLGRNELQLERIQTEEVHHLLQNVHIQNDILNNEYQRIVNSFVGDLSKAELDKKLSELEVLEEDARIRGLEADAFWLNTAINSVTKVAGAVTDVYGTFATGGLMRKKNFELSRDLKDRDKTINTAREYYREQRQHINKLEKDNAWMKRKLYGF